MACCAVLGRTSTFIASFLRRSLATPSKKRLPACPVQRENRAMPSLFPALFLGLALAAAAQVVPPSGAPLPHTSPLTETNDLASAMMQGLHRYAENRIAASPAGRRKFWAPDFSAPEKYAQSIAPNRERLQR